MSLPVGGHTFAAQWIEGKHMLRPKILLPKQMDWEDQVQLRYVLEHELAHIKRWDALWKICLAAVLACHWFNPFVWAMYLVVNRDMELACDEKVIRTIGTGQRAAYARMLVEWQAQKPDANVLASHLMQDFMQERIVNIMKTKKTGVAGMILSIALIAGAATVYAATPVRTESGSGQSVAKGLTLPRLSWRRNWYAVICR